MKQLQEARDHASENQLNDFNELFRNTTRSIEMLQNLQGVLHQQTQSMLASLPEQEKRVWSMWLMGLEEGEQ